MRLHYETNGELKERLGFIGDRILAYLYEHGAVPISRLIAEIQGPSEAVRTTLQALIRARVARVLQENFNEIIVGPGRERRRPSSRRAQIVEKSMDEQGEPGCPLPEIA